MKIAAITKFKNGAVFILLKKLNWKQSDLARATGIHPGKISKICSLRQRPSLEQAQTIQKAFGTAGEFLNIEEAWPDSFVPLKKTLTVEQVQDVDPAHLLEYQSNALMLAQDNAEAAAARVEAARLIEEMPLRPRDREIVMAANGLKGPPESYASIGRRLGLGREAVRQRHDRTIRYLYRQLHKTQTQEVALEEVRTGTSLPRPPEYYRDPIDEHYRKKNPLTEILFQD